MIRPRAYSDPTTPLPLTESSLAQIPSGPHPRIWPSPFGSTYDRRDGGVTPSTTSVSDGEDGEREEGEIGMSLTELEITDWVAKGYGKRKGRDGDVQMAGSLLPEILVHVSFPPTYGQEALMVCVLV